MMSNTATTPRRWNCAPRWILMALLLIIIPQLIAVVSLHLWGRHLSIPQSYMKGDDLWQLGLTKTLIDTGWILKNPYLGAPGIAYFHNNSAAQTSALHSVLMLALSAFFRQPALLQQIYFLANFSLITITSFIACRLLKIALLPAFAVGLIFAFSPFRYTLSPYAFLPNCFMIPLALVSVVWVIRGRFNEFFDDLGEGNALGSCLKRLIRTRDFILAVGFLSLMAASDGYYTFFTLVLLAYATFVRIIRGDWRFPSRFIPVSVFIVVILGTAFSLQIPLNIYKKKHYSEFFPNGVEDTSMMKWPFEAEVYSTTLKMLVAPIVAHSIEPVAQLGRYMAKTNDDALIFKQISAVVPLASWGSILLVFSFVLIAIPSSRRAIERSIRAKDQSVATEDPIPGSTTMLEDFLSLSFVIFLCSIRGGLGALIALAYPTIRAYERFPIFLIFVLNLTAAWLITQALRGRTRRQKLDYAGLIIAVTAAALFDEIPKQGYGVNPKIATEFTAEERFVSRIESILPHNAMVFNYPYAQYLRNDKYYGWGSFAGQRLYLQSHTLRWSNGGTKNSPADSWDYAIGQLPPAQLIAEIKAIGFQGLVIDRTVVSLAEYAALKQALIADGDDIIDDSASHQVFAKLENPGYRLFYDADFKQPYRLAILDQAIVKKDTMVSEFVDAQKLRQTPNGSVSRASDPDVFTAMTVHGLSRGRGDTPIQPFTDLQGAMVCATQPATHMITLTLKNQSSFPIWLSKDQNFPLGIGVHHIGQDGRLISFDLGYRAPVSGFIPPNGTQTFQIDRNTIPRGSVAVQDPVVMEFNLLQGAVSWSNISCKLTL